MENPKLTHWYTQFHMPKRHDMAVRMDHMVHDERFWPIVIAMFLIIAFITLALWVGLAGETNKEILPTYPFYP